MTCCSYTEQRVKEGSDDTSGSESGRNGAAGEAACVCVAQTDLEAASLQDLR